MNKLFKTLAASALGLALAVGVGVGVASTNNAKVAYAAISDSEASGLAVLTSSNFDASAEYVLKSTDGYYWNGVSGTSSSKWGGITKTLSSVERLTISGTWSDGFTIKDTSGNYLRATTGNMTWATTQAGTFKMGTDSASNPIVYNGTTNGLKVNGTSGIRLYTNLTYNASTGKSVALYKIPATKTLSSISVSENHRSFYTGDQFVKETVTAHYDDASTDDVTSDATFSGYDMNTAGQQTVNVSYEGKNTNYQITVAQDDLLSITLGGSVTGSLDNAWNLSGVTATGHYNSGSDKPLTGFTPTTNTPIPTEPGEYNVEVSVTVSGVSGSKTYIVNVAGLDGNYEIKSTLTTYTANVTSEQFKSNTTNSSNFDITISGNLRFGCSPSTSSGDVGNTKDIVLSTDSTSITFGISDGYVISQITTNVSAKGTSTATVTVGGVSKSGIKNNARTLITDYPFSTSVAISTNSWIYMEYINITVTRNGNTSGMSTAYSLAFNDYTSAECSAMKGISDTTWTKVKGIYNLAVAKNSNVATYLAEGIASQTGDSLGQALYRYDMIVAKYNKENFMSRAQVSSSNVLFGVNTSDNNTMMIVIISVAVASISLLGVTIFLKKKRAIH